MSWMICPHISTSPYISTYSTEREAYDSASALAATENCQVDVCVIVGRVFPKIVVERFAEVKK